MPSAALVAAALVAYLVTPLTSRLAHRFGVLDRPKAHGSHSEATPYLGGAAILCGLLAGALFLLGAEEPEAFSPTKGFGLAIAIGVALSLVGLLDDVYDLPRILRLAVQIGAAGAAFAAGFRVQMPLPAEVNALLTIVWFVGITNAFNLLDNMDGLTAGLAGVAALSFAVMGLLAEHETLTITAVALGGGALGFLIHNRAPAKIFMGDAGSLLLGFLLALIGLELRFDNLVRVTFLVPVVVLGLPIFDTTLVVLSRLAHRRSPFLGGRDHISHRLVRMGLPVRFSVGLLYWAGICLGWLGLVISRSNVQVGWMLLGFVGALALFFGYFLWRVPVYDDVAKPEPESQVEAELMDQVPPNPPRAVTG